MANSGAHTRGSVSGLEVAHRTFRRFVSVLVCSFSLVGPAEAQSGQVIGRVLSDSSDTPIAGATVVVGGLRRRTSTNDSGVFVLSDLPAGVHAVSIRRMGFEPRDTSFAVAGPADSVMLRLTMHALPLEGVDVTASRQRQNIQAFYERVMRGMGTYVTRADIIARKPLSATDLVRTIPGVRVLRGRGIDGVRFNTSALMRRDCTPMMWLDGQRAPGMELGEVPVSDVEGIELYNGPSTTPMQFSLGPTAPACGVVVVWTRPPPPR